MAYNYLVTRVNDLVRSMESAANFVLETLSDLTAAGAATTAAAVS